MLTSDQNRKINEIVEEFKEAADFYRMEYSEDLMGMFRNTPYGVFRRPYGDVSGFWVYAAFEG